jgi:LTXXQ motif family protein/pentapeptide repeat protein
MGPISKKLIVRLVVILGLATSVGVLGIGLGTADVALAGGKGGGGGGGGGKGGGGGGGGGKGGGWGGGGGHFSASHFSAAHYSGGHGYSAHVSSHVSHWTGGHHYSTRYSGHTHTTGIHTRTTNLSKTNLNKSNLSKSNLSKSNLSKSNVTDHSLKNAGQEKKLNEHVKPLKHASDPKNFKDRRDLANKTAFNSFWHQKWHENWWHHHHNFFHIGWIGPWFWPYAYGDFFYFALWPWDYWYYDPFWAYGWGDIYDAVFFPYSYDDYVQGPRAPERMARLKQGITQSCNEEAGEVTGWPIDQIQAAVEPDQRQGPLLDDLGNAIVKASDEIRAHCQTNIAFTPTGRLDQMHDRLGALVDGVNIVSPALSGFYDSLSDEQKARFNNIAPRTSRTARHGQAAPGDLTRLNIQDQCDAGMMAWPTDQIDRVVRPDEAQRAKLQVLQSAASQAADTIKTACPANVPPTPPARLAAVGQRLGAMLRGVETMQPALADFYNSLSDDQKARFNSMGRQLSAQNARNE